MSKKVEISIIALLIIFAFYCALSIGSSWDEIFVMTRGEERLKYLFSLGSYESSHTLYYPNERFYPGFYPTVATFFKNMFPKKYEIEAWHLINSLFSIFTFFGIYKISSILFNKKVGKIVFLLCFLNPIFFGHMAMNSKDTIVALSHVWTTYIFLRYIKKQNKNENCYRYVLLCGLTIGLGSGVRIPFVITLLPLFLVAILDIIFLKKISNQHFSLKKFGNHLILVLLIAYFITISCWPNVHGNIFTEPFKLFLAQIKDNVFGLPWLLYNGKFLETNQLPFSYIIVNFFYKSPEFILLLYVVFIYFIILKKKFFISKFSNFWIKILLILFIFIFPTIFFIIIPYNVYDGLRLFLYSIPYFNIIPGLALYYLIYNFNSLISKIFLGFISILFIYYIYIFILLTPYQYTYLNKFIGNFSYAHQKFENDYWAISVKELIKKIPKETNLIANNKKIKVTFCGAPHSLIKEDLNKVIKLNYEVGDLYSNEYEYVIMTNRVIGEKNDSSLTNVKTCFEKFKGKDIVTVKRNGLILSTLRKNN